jgi:hypothetical protein
MKITRIEGALPGLTEARAGRGIGAGDPGAVALAARVGAALSAPDPAAALRILVEEIRGELNSRLGLTDALPGPRPGPLDPDAAMAVLLRYLRSAAKFSAVYGDRPSEAIRQAVDAGIERAQRLLGASTPPPAAVESAVEQVATRLRAAAATILPRVPPAATEELPGAAVREIVATLSERIGMPPAGAAPARPPEGPREALAQLARFFRAVAEDSVLAVRASPRVLEMAVRDGVQRALATIPGTSRPDPALARLAADLTALALRAAAAPGAGPPPARDLPSALGLMVAEFRQSLAEWTAEPRPAAPPVAVRDARSALAALATASAETLLKVSPAQVVALRAVLESAAEAALGRSLLQLDGPAADPPARGALEELRVSFRSLLAAADSAAIGRGLDSRGWVGLVARAGEALEQGGAPPFRFDLPVAKAGPGRRRARVRAAGGPVESIESSDPEEAGGGDEGPAGPALWPRPPAG